MKEFKQELKKDFYVKSYKQVKDEHKKDYIHDLTLMKKIKKFTIDDYIIQNVDRLYNKMFVTNEYLTKKDVNIFYDLLYLFYLKNFFPFSHDTVDKAYEEYGFLLKKI